LTRSGPCCATIAHGSWPPRELHIHKQTLGYRIRKIEQLTGRGPTSTEHLAEWWFALRAHDLLTGRSPG
jgi:Regulator of polyketide synthase expression